MDVRALVIVAAIAPLALASCAGTQDAAAGSVAQQWLDAVGHGEGGRACELLAPGARNELEQSSGSPCAEAVLEEDVGEAGEPVVTVFDTAAQVRFASETVFLSRFDGDWLIIAAACTPRAARPYDCSIKVS